MNAHFLTQAERNNLLAELEQQFGIAQLPNILLETGKEKIRAFSGSMTAKELLALADIAHVEIIGLYVARKEHDLRLSFDATQLFAAQLSKNIIDITSEQKDLWIRGNDLPINAQRGTVIIRCSSDFLGCGKSTGEKITNHVPKERRLRK